MKTDRLESITDGVIAIAATIMVLELAVPDHDTFKAVFEEWPVFLAHFNSFFLIYIVWYGHAREFEIIKEVNSKIVLVNGVWLAMLSLIPFFTYWVGKHPNSLVPQFLYTVVFLLVTLLFQFFFFLIAKEYPDLKIYYHIAWRKRLPIYIILVIGLIACFIKPIYTMYLVFLAVVYMIILALLSK